MADHQEYLRTGAPAPYNGRLPSTEDAPASLNRSLVEYQSDKQANGQQHQKSYKEKVIAIARVWNEVTAFFLSSLKIV